MTLNIVSEMRERENTNSKCEPKRKKQRGEFGKIDSSQRHWKDTLGLQSLMPKDNISRWEGEVGKEPKLQRF